MISFELGSTFSSPFDVAQGLAAGVDFYNASNLPEVAGVSTAAAYSLNGVLFLALALGAALAISYFYSSLYSLISIK